MEKRIFMLTEFNDFHHESWSFFMHLDKPIEAGLRGVIKGSENEYALSSKQYTVEEVRNSLNKPSSTNYIPRFNWLGNLKSVPEKADDMYKGSIVKYCDGSDL